MADIHVSLDKRLHAYLLANEPPEHEELRKLREKTRAMPLARMQIAPEQGHFLGFLARLIGARRTLELGTFTGYSALAMALALPERGRVVTCDINVEWSISAALIGIGPGLRARSRSCSAKPVTPSNDLRVKEVTISI
jgi:O-methyltransferase